MSAINFPDPSQSPWNNPDTGTTYIFVDGCWKAATSTFGDLSTYASLSGATFTGAISTDGGLTVGGGALSITNAGRLDAPEINSMGTNGFYAKNPNNTSGYVLRGVDYLNNHTSEIWSNGNAKFGPYNKSSNTGYGVDIHAGAGSAFGGVIAQSTDTATSVGEFFAGYRGTSMVFQVTTGGNATFAGTINGTTVGTSDIKFKENIEVAPTQLADISAFELKTFDWKDEAPISDELKAQRKLGLIAQEVEAICPEMVCEVAGQGDDSYKAINHEVLIMKLLGAVKELSAKVDALEAG